MNSLVIYQGTTQQVLLQFECAHTNQSDSCKDNISSYRYCKDCFALIRDITSESYYIATATDIGNTQKKTLN